MNVAQQDRRATALDVARVAGVSKTTVSYVLNNTPKQQIPEHTRRKVHDAVERLNYSPSSAARALRRGRNDMVLLILPDWPLGHVVAGIVDELTTELDKSGLALLTRRRRDDVTLAAMTREIMPAAVLALGEIDEEDRTAVQDAGTFVASALLTADTPSGRTVVVPQEHIGEFQVQHLASRGHVRIGYAAASEDRLRPFVRLRVLGVQQAAAELGLDTPDIVHIDASIEAAKEAVLRWRALGIDGVAAYNDEMAAALLSAMQELKLSAPGDLALIGVDDEPLSRFLTPPLSTIRQNEKVIARHLAKVLNAGISGRPAPSLSSADAIEVVERRST